MLLGQKMKSIPLILLVGSFAFSICIAEERLLHLEYHEITDVTATGWFVTEAKLRKASNSTHNFSVILSAAQHFIDGVSEAEVEGPFAKTREHVHKWSFSSAQVFPIDLGRTRESPGEWTGNETGNFFFILTFFALDEKGSSFAIERVCILPDLTIVEAKALDATAAEIEWEQFRRAGANRPQQDEALKP